MFHVTLLAHLDVITSFQSVTEEVKGEGGTASKPDESVSFESIKQIMYLTDCVSSSIMWLNTTLVLPMHTYSHSIGTEI